MRPQQIWAPWRLAYLEALGEEERAARAAGAADPADASGGTFLDRYWREPERDEANLVVHRDEDGMILLNRYPYSGGHLLVALGDPQPRLLDYEPTAQAALWRLVAIAMDLVERTFAPQGVNVGINQGRAAGAGVPQHLHVHLVPRWSGDTNFISVVGEVRIIPQALESAYARYREHLPAVLADHGGDAEEGGT